MAVVVGRMVAVLEAQTAQFQARMDAAGQQLNRWNSAGAQARRSTAMLKTGFQQLAFEGLGMMPPALARVTAGMLTLVGPGGVLLAAVAVLGALSFAFERAGKKAQEFVEEANRVREFRLEHLKMLGSLGGEFQMTPAEELAALRARRAEIAKQIEARKALIPPTNDMLTQLGVVSPVANAAATEVDGLTTSLRNLDRQITLMVGDAAMEKFNFMVSNIRGATGFEFSRGGLRRGGFQAPVFGGAPSELHFLPRDPFAGIAKHFGRGTTPKPVERPGFQLTPQMAQMILLSLMTARQGNPLAGLGGLATTAAGLVGGAASGPLGWIGFGFSALAGIFGDKMDKKEIEDERRHKELIGELREGPARITQIFEGDPAASLYENRRQERLGGEPRNGGL